jgi:penicillin-binding protein 1A
MREEGMVTEDQYRQAINETPKYSRRTMGTTARLRGAPYAVDHVMRELESEMNIGMDELKKGGYRVETTIDFELQKLAEQTVRDVVRSSARRNVTTGAFVVMDRDGRILAEVGGVDYRKNQFNAVSNPSARRQPGSAFKPFVYATALKLGTVNLNSSVSNEKIVMPNPGGRAWVPQNSQGGSGGWMSLRRAFTSSYNLPAIHTLQAVGPQTVVAFSRDSFGFKSELVPVPALALGSSAVSPLEMAQAYSVFMLKGDRARPYVIDRIYGPDGEIVRRYQPEIAKNVLDGWVVDQMDQLMRGVVEYGTGRAARSVPYARGKTGTTNDNRDAWFCGYTDSLVGIAWIANEQVVNGRPRYGRMPGVFGGNTSINIWRGVMQAAERKYGGKIDFERAKTPPQRSEQPDDDFPTGNLAAPDEVIEDTIEPAPPNEDEAPATDNTTVTNPVTEGAKAKASEPSRTTAPPPTPSPSESNELEVCADSGMRASIYCPETVTRRYRKGTEPRRTCPQHGG